VGYGRALVVTVRTVRTGDMVIVDQRPHTVLAITRIDHSDALLLRFENSSYVLPSDGVLHAVRMSAPVHPPGRWQAEPEPEQPPLLQQLLPPSVIRAARDRERRRNGLA
jgi:hypothetical protein